MSKGTKKKGTWKIVVAVLVGLVVLGSCIGSSGEADNQTETTTGQLINEPTISEQQTESTASATQPETSATEPTTAEPTMTMGQKNALKKAKSYLGVMAFSYTGLIEQLEYEGYSHEDAVFGADNCGADWNEQAAKKAQSYLDIMAFSKDGLIEQLEYEGFTNEQAVYGAKAVGY